MVAVTPSIRLSSVAVAVGQHYMMLCYASSDVGRRLLTLVDNSIQYGEDLDVKTRDFDYPENEAEEDSESFEKG